MNFRLKVGLFVALIGTLVAFSLLTPQKNVPLLGEDGPASNGDPDNPNARLEWEYQRLADPTTGKIPEGIRSRELKFAKRLPQKTEKTLNWEPRGPVNKGGRTRAFAIDVLDENVMLAGAVTGGIWRTTDAGASWVKVTEPEQIHSVSAIVQDTRPGKEHIWYYGTGEFYGIVSGTSFTSRFSGDGIFKSEDGGLTWNQLESTASGTPQTTEQARDFDYIWQLAVDVTDTVNDVVLAASVNGVWRSADGGQTWNASLGLDTVGTAAFADYSAISQAPDGALLAQVSSGSTARGFHRSTDGGLTWTEITPPGHSASLARTVIGTTESNPNVSYWLSHTPGSGQIGHALWKYTYLSGDGSGQGGSWVNLSAQLPDQPCIGSINFDFGTFGTQSSFDIAIAVSPVSEDIVYIGGRSIFRSTDGFSNDSATSWIGGYHCDLVPPETYRYPNHHPDQHGMTFLPSNPDVLYNYNDGGIYRTDDHLADSVQWIDLNNGYVTTQFYTVAIEPGEVDNDIVVGGMQDNGTWFTNSDQLSDAWKEVNGADGSYAAITDNAELYVLSSQRGRVILKELDANGNEIAFNRIDPTGGPSNYNFINPFILDPQDRNILYITARNKIWRNDDISEIDLNDDRFNTISTNWVELNGTQLSILDGLITAIEASPALDDKLYLGTTLGKVIRIDSARGNAVDVKLDDSNLPQAYVSSIAANPFDGDEVMVTYSNYNTESIFHSSDGGASWVRIGGNLEENADGTGSGPAVYWSTIYPTFPTPTYFVGTSVGLFSTTELDGDNTVWEMEGPNSIGNVVINMIRTRTYDGKIVVGTHGNGVYSSSLTPAFVGIEDNGALAVNHKTFPNPFTNEVTFEVTLETDETVALEVFDLKGSRVYLSQAGKLTKGVNQIRWEARNNQGEPVPAGNYIYRITAGDRVSSGKILKQ